MKVSAFLRKYTSGVYRFRSLLSECWELLEAIVSLNPKGIHEETGDVLMTAQLWFASKTGLDWELCIFDATMQKVVTRIGVWKAIFQSEGLEFHPKYLIHGSNFRKKVKRQKALALARKEQKPTEG